MQIADHESKSSGHIKGGDKTLEMLKDIYRGIPEITNRHPGDSDVKAAEAAGTRLTYGEILPKGVLKVMDECHLNVNRAKVILDIGSGRGRLAIQCFDQFKHLKRVIGVEISQDRFGICDTAMELYVKRCIKEGHGTITQKNISIDGGSGVNRIVRRLGAPGRNGKPRIFWRTLEIYQDNVGVMKDFLDDADVDIVVMDVAFSSTMPLGVRTIYYSIRSYVREQKSIV
mmetsp:Transcript_6730/g.9316  ORF Transcript_6730/g.9316 Transcript_6730/m.9316 type:complete len:228 (+) Transcript_6730:177-860(+)